MADTHYYITSEVVDMQVSHISAPNQEEAVMRYVQGENDYGYDASFFDGYEVLIVAESKVDTWRVDEPPVPTVLITKVK
jgi:hypothetical protein